MKIVAPHEVTTLVTNGNYQAIGFHTARAALRHLMCGRVKGIDASGQAYTWNGDDSIIDNHLNTNHYNWSERNLEYFQDQPVLRSAGSMGNTVEWPIPTIVICTGHYGYRVRKNEKISLRQLYRHYKGICQLCLCHGPLADMTVDHVYPKSLGGSNHDFNVVLAHRYCNHKKGSQTPYLNADGKEVKARPMLPTGIFIPDIDIREEWKPYVGIN